MTRTINQILFVLAAAGSTLPAGPARAFIPSSKTIFGRVARNAGKGAYAIEQEVSFRTEADPIVLRERWIVENGDSMRLYVTSLKGATENWRLDVFYHDGKKEWSDGSQIRSAPDSGEFIEPMFHFRSPGNLLSWLVRARVAPPGLGQTRAFNKKTSPYAPEPGVRLARVGGSIAWAFGEPAPAQGPLPPQLWIEQDRFVIRRVRFPTQAELVAEQDATFAKGLHLPRARTVAWDNNSVSIRLLTVQPLPENANTRALFSSAALAVDGRAVASRLPEAAQVREFYSRFR